MPSAIVDTGPLVSFFDKAQRHHRWSADRIEELDAPLLLCEPVLTEAMHLLRYSTKAQQALLTLFESGALRLAFHVEDHVAELRALMVKYKDVPMSLADACIVRMAELHERHAVLTLDSDFSVYRKHGRVPLALLHPP